MSRVCASKMRVPACSTPICASARLPTTLDFNRSPNSIAPLNGCSANRRAIFARIFLRASAPAKPLSRDSRCALRRGDVNAGGSGRCTTSAFTPKGIDAPAAGAVENNEEEDSAIHERELAAVDDWKKLCCQRRDRSNVKHEIGHRHFAARQKCCQPCQ